MNAKSFGVFLAQTRRERGLTQSALAEQLHVTDKAVSRWERGLGFPDIGTLEPLAQALGLTLEELMQAGRSPDAPIVPARQLQPARALLEPPAGIEWRSVRIFLFWAAAAVAVAALFLLPAQVATQWHLQDGILYPGTVLPTPLFYLSRLGFTVLMLLVWKNFEQGSFFLSLLIWLRVLYPQFVPWFTLGWQLFCCLLCYLASAPVVSEIITLLFNR